MKSNIEDFKKEAAKCKKRIFCLFCIDVKLPIIMITSCEYKFYHIVLPDNNHVYFAFFKCDQCISKQLHCSYATQYVVMFTNVQ